MLLPAWIALVISTLEEVSWRGTYVQVFPRQAFWGFIYPSLSFGLWHAETRAARASNPPA